MDCWDYDKKSMPEWKGAFSTVVLFTVLKKYSVEKDSQYAKYIKKYRLTTLPENKLNQC